MSSFRNLKNIRLNQETSNAGIKWSEEDIENLNKCVKDNVPINEIALLLKRTEGSIKTRLIMSVLVKISKDNMSMEDASKEINLTVNDIIEFRKKTADREERRKKKFTKKPEEDIYVILNRIEEKINKLLV